MLSRNQFKNGVNGFLLYHKIPTFSWNEHLSFLLHSFPNECDKKRDLISISSYLNFLSFSIVRISLLVEAEEKRNMTARVMFLQKQSPRVVLRNFVNLKKNTCARVSLIIKLQTSDLQVIKKSLWHRCFTVNVAKFLRKHFVTEHLWWLLLFLLSNTSRYNTLRGIDSFHCSSATIWK